MKIEVDLNSPVVGRVTHGHDDFARFLACEELIALRPGGTFVFRHPGTLLSHVCDPEQFSKAMSDESMRVVFHRSCYASNRDTFSLLNALEAFGWTRAG